MNLLRLSLSVVLLLLAGACVAGPPEDATGDEIYELSCARCHGGDLGGGIGPALDAGSEAAGRTDDFYRQTIQRGRGRMPSFRSQLTSEQIDRLIEFIRSRQ